MNDQVDEIKGKTDIISIIGERIEIKKAGRNYKALCPFHSEKSPSFMVSPELQIYKCFGCGESGDVISFLEKFEGMDFREALKFLADRVGVKLESFSGKGASEKERILEVNSEALKLYKFLLTDHPLGARALSYLQKDRGIKRETIDEFQLGFSPARSSAIKRYLVDKKGYKVSDLERAGIGVVRGGQVYDRLWGRIIFPLFDHRGAVVGFSGRILPWDKSEMAKYINTPETPAYHKGSLLYGLHKTKEFIKKKAVAIVVEGELDLLSSWQVGVKNTVAIKGSAFTPDQIRLLGRFCKKLILALDADLAGDAATLKGIANAFREGFEMRVARLKDFKDPDEAARESPDEYKKSLIKAQGVWDYLIDSKFEKYDAGTGEGVAKISRELTPILKSIDDEIVAEHYIELVAKRLGVDAETVLNETEKQTSSFLEKTENAEFKTTIEKKGRKVLLEERLLTLCFQSNPEILFEERFRGLISTPLTKRIVDEYEKYAKRGEKFSPSAFSENLPKELQEGFFRMVLAEEEVVEFPDRLVGEIENIAKELTILDLRHSLEETGVKIHEFEEKKDESALKNAQIEFGKLSQKLSELERANSGGIILNR